MWREISATQLNKYTKKTKLSVLNSFYDRITAGTTSSYWVFRVPLKSGPHNVLSVQNIIISKPAKIRAHINWRALCNNQTIFPNLLSGKKKMSGKYCVHDKINFKIILPISNQEKKFMFNWLDFCASSFSR